jgi:hypothetical protein
MATDSQGSTFVFASATYTVTSVTVTPGGDLLDNSHLGLASGSNRTYQSPALIDDEVSVEAFGTATVAVGSSGSLVFQVHHVHRHGFGLERGLLGWRACPAEPHL